MKKTSYIFLVVILLTFSVIAQTKTEAALKVEVEGGKSLSFTVKDLEKFARQEVKAKGHDENESTFSGYKLSDILIAAGAKLGAGEMRGKELASYLLVEAGDGYKVIFAMAEIASEFNDKNIILADMKDGKPLDEKQGKWQIIVPGEKKWGRWVRQVESLKIVKIDYERKTKEDH